MPSIAEPRNAWRTRTDGQKDWSARLSSGASDKYFIVSADTHVNEPLNCFVGRVSKDIEPRLPHIQTDETGTQWLITDGYPPQPVLVAPGRSDLIQEREDFESYEVLSPYSERMEPEDVMRSTAGRSIEQRLEHCREDGVDAEIIFPQKGLLSFATPDTTLSTAMCVAWNEWALENFSSVAERMLPVALIAPGNVDEAIKNVQWAASNGFHSVMLPNRPIFSRITDPRNPLQYNDKRFEKLWAAIAETGLPIVFHVGTGEDPRAVRGNGGAIINFISGAVITTLEPLVQLIASGVFERHRALKSVSVESGIGWIPWLLMQMDHGYRAHHMWVRPVIPHLPSEYFRNHCFCTFVEEPQGLAMCMEIGLEDNVLWSNDYPHSEGSFPHSSVTIERSTSMLSEAQRRKALGENAARVFNIKRI